MSKQFALTSASIASASDNVVAPRNKGEFVVEDVVHCLSHVDTIYVHVGLAHAEGQVSADAIVKRISSRHEPFIFGKKRWRAAAPRPSFFEGNPRGPNPWFWIEIIDSPAAVAFIFCWKLVARHWFLN